MLKSTKFSKIIVVLVIAQAFLYTWVHLILSAVVGIEIAPTATVSFYAFCGAEAGLLAFIRKIDKKYGKAESEEQNYEECNDSEVDEP